MKRKTKIIASSMLAIAMSASLVAGGTYSLFTSESKMNVSVTSGTVKILATPSDLKTYSVVPTEGGSITDEFGGKYAYAEQSGGAFINGGTATITDGNVITLDKVTPGDKVSFNVSVTNQSNVAIKYRVRLACNSGDTFCTKLEFTVGDQNLTNVTSTNTYTSAWATLAVGRNPESVAIEIALPVSVGNEYQNNTTAIIYTVEAVQSNAAGGN